MMKSGLEWMEAENEHRSGRDKTRIWTSKLVMTNQERGIPHDN